MMLKPLRLNPLKALRRPRWTCQQQYMQFFASMHGGDHEVERFKHHFYYVLRGLFHVDYLINDICLEIAA